MGAPHRRKEETYEAEGIKEEYQYFTHPEGQQKIKHGWYRSYYPDGTAQSAEAYRGRGKISAGEKRHGRWVYFDIHGRDPDEDIWRNGKCVERCEGNEIQSAMQVRIRHDPRGHVPSRRTMSA